MSYCQDILPQPTKRRYDPSNKSALRQRNIGPVANDDVIQQPDVDQRQRLFDPLGDQFVRLAGLGDPGGVIVGDDDGRAITLQCMLHDLARMHAGALRVPFSECLQIR